MSGMAESTDDSEVRVYLQSKLRRASVLMSNLSNRKKTVLRVIETVVQCQPLYFKKGRSFLKPMTMKSVAEQLDLNESTISRAIQNKFILCPLGIVSLKSLFTCPVNARPDNSAASSAEVKEKIKEIIKTEDKTRPLSDQRIMAELGKSDFAISRRTVAKYRDELGILSAAGRKTYQEE
jgi:RNA polymerase sigma-54 factor